MTIFKLLLLTVFLTAQVSAADSLNYSGRLVNADGSPVSGPVNLVFDLVYTNAPAVVVCSKSVTGVTLVNGVFTRKLDFTSGECGGSSLLTIIEATPANESVAIKITDSTNSRVYAAQAVNAMPYSLMANMAKTLVRMGAASGQVLTWNGTQWAPATPTVGGGGTGTVTSIATGTGLTGGPITTTGTISIAASGVTTTQIADGTIANIDVSTTAAIARTKLASGTASHVLVNDGSGVMSSVAQLPLTQGGTGATTASGARASLGLGTAAVANIGTAIGGVMGSDAVPNCLASQKLQMSVGPVYSWTCATDETFSGGGLASAVDMNSNKITELGTPTVGTDAANKAYVDAQIAGVPTLQWDTVVGGHINFAGGRVGIGDTTPSEALDVAANARVAGDAQVEGKLRLKSTTANYVELAAPAGLAATRSFTLPSTLGSSGEVLTTDGAGVLSWSAVSGGGGSNWTLASGDVYRATGKVGIGTATPDYKLEVAGTGSEIIVARDTSATGYSGINLKGTGTQHYSMLMGGPSEVVNGLANKFAIYDGLAGLSRLVVTSTGNVGIGNTSPGSALDVKGELRLSGSSSGYVGFTPPATAGSTTYTLPNSDGATGEVLTTNGSGVLSWTAGGGAASVGGDLSGTVANSQIAANAVGTTEIANSSVTYAKTNFADGDIPAAKISGLSTDLAGKEPTITAGTSAQYYRGDKTMQTLDTAVVPENGNLYFLDSRVRTALMSGYTIGSALPIAATDTLLEALAKLEGSIAAVQSNGQWTEGSGNVYRTSGNVGIGTASPTSKLQVFTTGTEIAYLRDSTNAAEVRVQGSAVNTILNFGNRPLQIQFNDAPHLTMDTAGKVGIGVTAPTTKLQVAGSIVIGNGGETCSGGNFAGAIRYNGGSVEFCNGSAWQAFSASGGSTPGDNTVTSAKITDGSIVDADVSAGAAIDATKLGTGAVTNTELSYLDGVTSSVQTQLNAKEGTVTAGTSAQYYRGDKTMQTLDTGVVPENGNLYFLDSRVRSALMSGYAIGSALPIAATDTLLEALAKLEGSIAAVQAGGQWTAGSGNVYRTTGNVGIGTATPSGTFEVAGGTAAAATDGSSITLTAQNGGAGNQNGGNIVLIPGTKTGTGTEGSVGIGSAPPAWTGQGGLSVVGGIITGQRISAGTFLQFNNSGGPSSGISWADGLTQITKDSSGSVLTFLTNNLERMRVDVSGNVGIGTTSPDYHLDIHQTNGSLRVKSDSGQPNIILDGPVATNRQLSFQTSTSNRWVAGVDGLAESGSGAGTNFLIGRFSDAGAYIDAPLVIFRNTGNVGIGVTVPTTKLQVAGSLVIGNGGETCSGGNFAGAIRYNGGSVEFCNGSAWQAFSASGGSTPGDNTVTSAKITDGSIVDADVSAGAAIDATKLGTGAVTNTELSYLDGVTSSVQTQLNAKEGTVTAGTSAQYYRGDKTMQTLNTAAVPESGNLYFLDSRVRAALMSGYAIGSALPIAATDTLLEALAKLEGSIAAVQAGGQWTAGSGNVYRTTGNVGIGTTSPSAVLELNKVWATPASTNLAFSATSYGDVTRLSIRRANGTEAAPAAILNGEVLGNLNFRGHDGTNFSSSARGAIYSIAAENFTSTAQGSHLVFNTSPIGTTVGVERLRITSEGKIGIGTAEPTARLTIGSSTGVQSTSGIALGGDNNSIEYVTSIAGNGYGFKIAGDDPGGGTFLRFQGRSNSATWNNFMSIADTGNVGIGVTAPTAALHLKAGTTAANTAPLKFTAGPVMTTPENGAMEYDGTNLSFTIGTTRYTVPLTSSSGAFTSTSSISNSSGNIELAPNLLSGSVNVTAGTSSVSAGSGALVVTGGVGVGGSIFSGGSVNAATNLSVGVNGFIPQLYGSSSAGGDILIDGTSNASKGDVLLATAGGNVGVGTALPTEILQVSGGALRVSGVASDTARGGVFLDWSSGTNVGRVLAGNASGSILTFSTNNAGVTYERLRIDSSGNVGIGVLAPAAKLDISGTSGLTLKITDGNQGAGKVLTSDANGVASWTAPASGSAWSIKTSAYTASVGDRLMVDTSGGAVTVTLPASASLGDTIAIIDVAGTFATNALTIARNGLRVMGLTEDMTVSSQNISFELVYSNATYGWRIK